MKIWTTISVGLLCLVVAGCQSVRFGPLLADASATAPLRARIGPPMPVPGDVKLVAVQEPIKIDEPEEPANARVLDLAEALARAGADNPTIAIADEAVQLSLAERMQARALLFPTLDAGANLRVHRGRFISGGGTVFDADLQSLYWGFGAEARGGGTVAIPGVRLVSHLADAWYAPKAGQQRVVQTRMDAAATRQYMLMEVGVRYLALVEAQARLRAYRQSLLEFAEIERLTAGHAKAEQGRDSDAKRASAEAMLLRAEMKRAEEAVGSAAAELARVLDWDPATPLRSADVVPPLLELVRGNMPLSELLDEALATHPEITARDAEVAYQEIILRQEKARPFLPVVALGFSAGEFGGSGRDATSRLGDFNARTDLDIVAVWSLQNFGAGNRAVQNVARTGVEMAEIARAATIERIRREVTEARSQVEARRQDIVLARARIETSQRAYAAEFLRVKNLVKNVAPIELLRSANQLADARQDLIRAMVGYSQAQLQLHAALGKMP